MPMAQLSVKLILRHFKVFHCVHSSTSDTSSIFQANAHIFNPLNAELNPICHLLALLGAHHILHVSRIRVKTYFYHISPTCFGVLCAPYSGRISYKKHMVVCKQYEVLPEDGVYNTSKHVGEM